jgi:hypothetical protein
VTFGLGSMTNVKDLTVKWPGGRVETLGGMPAGQTVTVTEGKGITQKTPFRAVQ